MELSSVLFSNMSHFTSLLSCPHAGAGASRDVLWRCKHEPCCCSAGTWYLTVSGARIPNSLFALSGGTFALPYSPMECLNWAAQQPAQARIDNPQMTHLLSVLSTLAYEDTRIVQDVITHR